MVPRGLLACLALGVALALLPDGCCECGGSVTCDFTNIALELPPGQSLTLHAAACFDGLDPTTLDESSPYGFVIEFGSDEDTDDLTLTVDGPPNVTVGPEHLYVGAQYSQALCDDGLIATLTNTGAASVTGIVNFVAYTDDEGRPCDLVVEQP